MRFQYTKLDENARQIRLIDLHAGKADQELRLTLRHVSLSAANFAQRKRLPISELQKTLPSGWVVEETSQYRYRYLFEDADENTSWHHPDASCDPTLWQELEELPPQDFEPAYEALSYVWGSQENPEVAFIDSAPAFESDSSTLDELPTISIGQNLSNGLRALRYPDNPRTLWVDAICIDQTNNEERSSQVKHMHEVYKLAQRVVVWLGPSTSSTYLAMETFDYLGSQVEVSRRHARFRSPKAVEPDWFRAATELPYDEKTWQAIDEFLNCSWFERLWIWQEIQLANSRSLVVCGSHQLDWQCFRRALICLYTKDKLPFPGLRRRFEMIEPLAYERHTSSAYLLLEISRQRLCSEPKDHIYGMLSICGPHLANEIMPNYSPDVPYHEVFKDVFLKYSERVQRLDLLSECEQTGKGHSGPSWVPDWSVRRSTYPLYGFTFASGVSSAKIDCITSNILQVQGVQAGMICSVTEPAPADDLEIMKTWKTREPTDMRTATYPTGGSLLEAYCSTLRASFLLERWPQHAGVSTADWTSQYLQSLSDYSAEVPGSLDTLNNVDVSWCLKIVRERTIFRIDNGHIGIGPSSTRVGDIVCILLGCKSPMVLRPLTGGGGHSGYTVVGECYVYGLDDGSVLLGPLPSNFRVQLGKVESGHTATHRYRNLTTNEVTEDDPRLQPLPSGWVKINRGREPDDPTLFGCYRHIPTGRQMNSDPRLQPNALKDRGVELRTFDLK